MCPPPPRAGQTLSLPLELKGAAVGTYNSLWRLADLGGEFGPTIPINLRITEEQDPLQLVVSQSLLSGNRSLQLGARVSDSLGRNVEAGDFRWSLLDLGGTAIAAGRMVFGRDGWSATPTLDTPLRRGRYQINYQINANDRSGKATKELLVAGNVMLTGRVTDSITGVALNGAAIRIGSRATTSNREGAFSLTDVDLSIDAEVRISLAGYQPRALTVAESANNQAIVVDARLSRELNFAPTLRSFRAEILKLVPADVPLTINFFADVDWNGPPGKFFVYHNGVIAASVNGRPQGMTTIPVNFPRGISSVGTNTFTASAQALLTQSASGRTATSATERKATIEVAPFFEPLRNVLRINRVLDQIVVGGSLVFEIGKLKVPVPKLPLEFDVEIELGVEARLGTGSVEFMAGAGGEWSKKRRPLFQKQLPKTQIRFGDLKLEPEFIASALGTLGPPSFFNPTGMQGELKVKGSYPIGKWGPQDVLIPSVSTALSRIPIVRDYVDHVSVSIDGEATISGKAAWTAPWKLSPTSANIAVAIGLKGGYNPKKLPGGAELDIYLRGALTGEGSITPKFAFDSLDFKVSAGYRVQLPGIWIIRVENSANWDLFNWNIYRGQNVSNSTGTIRPVREARTYLEFGLPRFQQRAVDPIKSRLAGPRRAEANLPAELSLVENVYPRASPAIATWGSEAMVLYVSDNGSTDPIQYSSLYWTRFDGSNWSSPVALSDDPRAVSAPRLVFDRQGNGIAVWQRLKDANFSADDPEGWLARQEIVTSNWNRSTGTWSTPVALTDNSFLDHEPLLAAPAGDGPVVLAWMSNAQNLIQGEGAAGAASNSFVWSATLNEAGAEWSAPVPVSRSSRHTSLALATRQGRKLFAWSGPENPEAEKANHEIYYVLDDGQGWSESIRLTADEVDDRAVQVRFTGEVPYFVWRRGEEAVSNRGLEPNPQLLDSKLGSLAILDSELVAGPNGALAQVWSNSRDGGSVLMGRFFDSERGTWGVSSSLSSDPGVDRSVTCGFQSEGSMTCAWIHEELLESVVGGRVLVEKGRADLRVTRKAPKPSIRITEAVAAADSELAGSHSVPITVTVENTGDVTSAESLIQALEDVGDGRVAGQLAVPRIAPGTSFQSKLIWTPNANSNVRRLLLRLDGSNSVYEIPVFSPRTQVTVKSAERSAGGSARIIVEVLNEGPRPIVFRINVDDPASSRTLLSVELPVLQPGESTQSAIDIPSGQVGPTERSYVLRVRENREGTEVLGSAVAVIPGEGN